MRAAACQAQEARPASAGQERAAGRQQARAGTKSAVRLMAGGAAAVRPGPGDPCERGQTAAGPEARPAGAADRWARAGRHGGGPRGHIPALRRTTTLSPRRARFAARVRRPGSRDRRTTTPPTPCAPARQWHTGARTAGVAGARPVGTRAAAAGRPSDRARPPVGFLIAARWRCARQRPSAPAPGGTATGRRQRRGRAGGQRPRAEVRLRPGGRPASGGQRPPADGAAAAVMRPCGKQPRECPRARSTAQARRSSTHNCPTPPASARPETAAARTRDGGGPGWGPRAKGRRRGRIKGPRRGGPPGSTEAAGGRARGQAAAGA